MKSWNTCASFARAYNAEIVVLYVVDPPLIRVDFEEEVAMIQGRKMISDKIEELNLNQELNVSTLVKVGKPYKKVIEAALEIDPLMIVMGTHGASGFEEFFIGSNASRTIRAASCPVVTVRNPHDGDFKEILLPLDMTKDTKEKVAKSLELAQHFNARLHLVAVLTSDIKDQADYLRAQLEGVENYIKSHHIECDSNFIETSDDIGTAVLKYSQDCDADFICIMTQQEKSLKEYFVGSVAEHIVNHSEIPVLSIRPSNLYVAKKTTSIFG